MNEWINKCTNGCQAWRVLACYAFEMLNHGSSRSTFPTWYIQQMCWPCNTCSTSEVAQGLEIPVDNIMKHKNCVCTIRPPNEVHYAWCMRPTFPLQTLRASRQIHTAYVAAGFWIQDLLYLGYQCVMHSYSVCVLLRMQKIDVSKSTWYCKTVLVISTTQNSSKSAAWLGSAVFLCFSHLLPHGLRPD